MRRFHAPIAIATALAAILAAERAASACSYAELKAYTVDTSSQDREPPAQPVVLDRGVHEGGASGCGGCGYDRVLNVVLEIEDDVTPSADAGILVELASGSLPGGIWLPDGPVELFDGDTFFLRWDDGRRYEFTLRFTPIDRAGNQGEPVELHFENGIHCSAGGAAAVWLPVLAALAFAVRRRGSRSRVAGCSRAA